MNERINKLADNATHYANGVCDADANADWYETRDQKFAELVVEEFRTVLTDEYRKTPLECCGHFLRADEAIAKHFYGVN